MYDVVIVGGGPAGATLARLLAGRGRVLLVERRADACGGPGPRAGKACGGLVAPDAQRALAAQGLGVPREVLVGPQLFAVRAIDVASGRERSYQRHYLNVDRARLDAWLRSLVPPEVEVRRGVRVAAVRDEGDAVAVRLEAPGATEVVRSRLVVGADGAASRVRRDAFPAVPAPPLYVAIQEWFEARHAEPCYTALFDAGATDFYGWAIPKAGAVVVGAALEPGAGAPARFERVVRALEVAGLRLGRSLGREGTLLARPARPAHVHAGAGRVALVGEAAGLVSPSSGEGLSFALASAASLAAALAPGLEGWEARHHAGTAALRRAVFVKLLKARALAAPALRAAALASGVGAIPVGEAPAARPGGAGAPIPAR